MDKHDIYESYIERLHEAAASGEVEMLEAALKVLPDVNVRNHKGWTALMFAARNGKDATARILLQHGCDKSIINSTGQTALDIALFWNNKAVAQVLQDPPQTSLFSLQSYSQEEGSLNNYFCGNPLNRFAHKRKDKEWLEQRLRLKSSKIVLFHDLKPLVKKIPDHSGKGLEPSYCLLTVSYESVQLLMDLQRQHLPEAIFLGLEASNEAGNQEEGSAWFAMDASHVEEETLKEIHPYCEVVGVYPVLLTLSKTEGAIFGQARSVLAWHDRYQFCPTCGSKTVMDEGGYKRRCTKEDCRSLQGVHNTSYPRIDPTVIMAVVSPDGTQLLLGRGSRFPPNFYSCLAGFMEPGESMEEACRREVFEEAGVRVGRVDYHSCQPWPLPSSLMIGCLAYATSNHIQIDKEELEDARWFSRQEVVQLLTHQHPQKLFCPPEKAIAHQLMRTWVNMTSNL